MYVTRHIVTITTAADGSGTGYTPVVNGRVLTISYVKATSGSFADSVDFSIETENSKVTIWDEDNVTATKAIYPRAKTHTTGGAENDADVDCIPVANERIKISVEGGGDSKTGTFYVMVG